MTHYYDSKPATESKPQEIAFRMRGIDFLFTTDRGVFSKTQLDFGSELLLKTVMWDLPQNNGNGMSLLDLGCGYGPIGTVLKRVFPAITVTMADINERAVLLAIVDHSTDHEYADVWAVHSVQRFYFLL